MDMFVQLEGFLYHFVILFESKVFYNLFHPSISKFYGFYNKFLKDRPIVQHTIITEYISHGSLREILDKEKKAISKIELTSTQKYIILLGISDAMRYLHEKGVIHGDLKAENIFIDSYYYPCINDYYQWNFFPKLLTNFLKSGQNSTQICISPEVLRFDDHYDSSVDVYAFSMIAYEIVTGKVPFIEKKGESISPKKIIEGYRPKFTESVTKKMKILLSKCWSSDPSERPTFGEIFDQLSSDMTYFKEKVDKKEINKYLKMLSSSSKSKEKNPDEKKIESSENQLEDLISKLTKIRKVRNESNGFIYSVAISILNEKKYCNIKQVVNDLKISSDQGNLDLFFLDLFMKMNLT